jgi:galactonate dehydratase
MRPNMRRQGLPAIGVSFAQQSTAHPLTITGFRAWRLKEPVSGRRYTVLKLQSQGGEAGYGEGGPSSGIDLAEARAAALGRRATEAEFIRARLAKLPALEAAVSNDLVCRSRKVPIYQYLGGPTRFKARLLGQLEGIDENTIGPSLERAKRQGIQAFTMPALIRSSMIPLQEYADRVRDRVQAIRSKGGDQSDWVLDGAASMTAGDAATVAKALERQHLLWLDEPTPVLTTDALAKITDESVMPVGLGREVTDIGVFQNLLRYGSVNVLRPSLGLNSLHKIKRMAAIAETHYVAVAPYHNGGPIGTLAGIHLNASLPNSFAQQVPVPADDRDAAMRAGITGGNLEIATKGYAALINKPGLGINVNEQALDAFSEERL